LYKRLVFLVALLVAAAVFLPAFGRKEKAAPDSRTANSEIKAFLEAEKLWKSLGITSYRAEVLYRRSNFPAEIFIITVEGDDVSGYSRQKPSESCPDHFLRQFTAKELFEKVRKSLESDGSSPMELKAQYDEEKGFVKKLSRVPKEISVREGEETAAQRGAAMPRDTGYHIEILEFEVLAQGENNK
jgi:hypothetical protein